MTTGRRTANLLLAAALGMVAALAVTVGTVTGPAATASVGLPYSSSCSASVGGGAFISNYAVNSGSLPGGLVLDSNTCAITGTPNTPGTFNFTIAVTYSFPAENVTASQSAKGVKQAGPSGATLVSPQFTITVGGGSLVAGAPAVGEWVMFGLAGAMALLGGIMLRRKQSAL